MKSETEKQCASLPRVDLLTSPHNIEALYIQAEAAFLDGDFLTATRSISQAMPLGPWHVASPLRIYRSFVEQDRQDEAIAFLDIYFTAREDFTYSSTNTYLDSLRLGPYVDHPISVIIESLASCNASCSFCQYPEILRKGTKMPTDVIDDLIDRLVEWMPSDLPFTITWTGLNEPFLDNRIFEILEKTKQSLPQANLQMNSNGAPLTRANIERLAKTDLQQMSISLNLINKESYETVMGIPYDRTIEVIDTLAEFIDNGEIKFPMGLTRAGTRTIEDLEFIEWCEENYPQFSRYFSPVFGWIGDDPVGFDVPKMPCIHWYELTIRAAGEVAFCCLDGHIKYPLGNIHSSSLESIYNTPTLRHRRTNIFDRSEVQQCSQCTHG